MIHYARFNAHSAYIPGGSPETLDRIVEACKAGTYIPERYRIFQIFPGLIVALIRAIRYGGDEYWFVLVQQIQPTAPGKSHEHPVFSDAVRRPAGPIRRAFRAWNMPWMRLGLRVQATRIHNEDHVACENQQRVAARADGLPILSRQETRVGWFEEEYARIMAGHLEPDGRIMTVSGLDA